MSKKLTRAMEIEAEEAAEQFTAELKGAAEVVIDIEPIVTPEPQATEPKATKTKESKPKAAEAPKAEAKPVDPKKVKAIMDALPPSVTPANISQVFVLDSKTVRRHLRKFCADTHTMKTNWQFTHDATLEAVLAYFETKYPVQKMPEPIAK